MRRENSSSGSIGYGVVASRQRKMAKNAIPASPGTTTSGAPQPDSGWRISASVGPASIRNDSTAPTQSTGGRAPWRSRCGTAIATRTIVIAMNGTFSAKIQRHENASISCPPTSGPTTVAIPDHAVHEPIAAPRWAGGKAATMTASAAGDSSAPNMPWSTRPPTITSMLGATAQTIDATPKPSTPTENTRRSPNTSPSDPPMRISEASASR